MSALSKDTSEALLSVFLANSLHTLLDTVLLIQLNLLLNSRHELYQYPEKLKSHISFAAEVFAFKRTYT